MIATFTVDVEQDVPPFLKTWRGVEEGLPLLLDALSTHDICTTFFVTGETAEKYPELIRSIPRKHEIGCHGYKHERLDKLSPSEQFTKIKTATEILRRVTGRKILGFRAPNFKLNEHIFVILKKLGYLYDASSTCYHFGRIKSDPELVEVPNTFFSSFLRLPSSISLPVLRLCARTMPLVVLDYHVWEVVEMKNVRFDYRFATGVRALRRLHNVFKSLSNTFETKLMSEIAKERKTIT